MIKIGRRGWTAAVLLGASLVGTGAWLGARDEGTRVGRDAEEGSSVASTPGTAPALGEREAGVADAGALASRATPRGATFPCSGRVVEDATGRAVANARVVATAQSLVSRDGEDRWETVAERTATTDGTGRAQFDLACGPSWSVSVHVDGFAPGLAPAGPAVLPFAIRLRRTASIAGTVTLDEDGRPLEGVAVVCSWGDDRAEARTDAAGRYRCDGLGGGPYDVVAFSRAFGPAEDRAHGPRQMGSLEPGSTTQVDFVIAPTLALHGHVSLASGGSASGADVWVVPRQGEGSGPLVATLRTKSGPDGSFRIEGLPSHRVGNEWAVHAVAPGTAVGRTELTPQDPGTASAPFSNDAKHRASIERDLRIVLPPPSWLEIDLLAGPTAPAGGPSFEGAAVWVTTAAVKDAGGKADARGHVRVGPLASGPAWITVQAPGWRPSTTDPVPVEVPVEGTAHATMTLQRGCRIAGRLVYEDGSPADDRRFEVWARGEDGHGCGTDVRGSFEFRDLVRQPYEVQVTPPSPEAPTPPVVFGRATVLPDATDAVIVVSGRRPQPLRIEVTDASGSPLDAAVIRLQSTDSEVPLYAAGLDSDAPVKTGPGTWSQDGLAIPVFLQIRPLADPDAMRAPVLVGPVVPGAGSVKVRLGAGFAVTGRVLGPDDVPIQSAKVYVVPDDESPGFARWQDILGEARTGADGRFTIERLPPELVWVLVESPKGFGDAEPLASRPGDGDVTFRLHRRVDVEIRIQDPDGRPVPNAFVFVYEPPYFPEQDARGIGDAAGVAKLTQLDPEEEVLLEVRPPRGTDALRVVRLPGWKPSSRAVTLERAVGVRVHVVDEKGTPVPAAWVGSGGAPWDAMLAPMTDETGTVFVPRTTVGPFSLVARQGARTSDPTTVAARAAEVTLVVHDRAGVVRVQCIDDDGVRHATRWDALDGRMRATLWDPTDPTEIVQASYAADGSLEFVGLRPDRRFDVLLGDEGSPQAVGFARGLLADGTIQRVPWVPTKTLRGRVVLEPTDTFGGLEVLETGRISVSLDATGHFALPGLPEGRWTLRATVLRRREPLYATVVAEGEVVPDLVFPPR